MVSRRWSIRVFWCTDCDRYDLAAHPLERVNKEINRRSQVVGIFPNDAAIVRLVGTLLIEQTDEWHITRRYMSQESLAKIVIVDTKLMIDGGQAAKRLFWRPPSYTTCMDATYSRRAGCAVTRTSGSEGGRRKRSRENPTTAPPVDPTPAAGTRRRQPVPSTRQRTLREGRHAFITSNRGFRDWGEVFGDNVIAAALLARLLHHAIVIDIQGSSYRLRDHAHLMPSRSIERPPRPSRNACEVAYERRRCQRHSTADHDLPLCQGGEFYSGRSGENYSGIDTCATSARLTTPLRPVTCWR